MNNYYNSKKFIRLKHLNLKNKFRKNMEFKLLFLVTDYIFLQW